MIQPQKPPTPLKGGSEDVWHIKIGTVRRTSAKIQNKDNMIGRVYSKSGVFDCRKRYMMS